MTIGFEATGHYWALLAEELARTGYASQLFNPILTADAGRKTVRGRTTDEEDCLAIAKVLRDGWFGQGHRRDRRQPRQVAKVAEETTQAAVQLKDSAGAMARMAGELSQVVKRFTV